MANSHVAELLRFIFLGTVVETSRLAGQKAIDFVKHCEHSYCIFLKKKKKNVKHRDDRMYCLN